MSDEGSIPYVVALFCARNLDYDYVLTRPGFMAESLYVLAQSYGTVSEVRLVSSKAICLSSMLDWFSSFAFIAKNHSVANI